MKKKLLIVLALTCVFVTQANAQGIGLGPQAGFYKADDADDGNLMGGAALRIKLSNVFGVEGAINYKQEKYSNGALTVRSWPVMATGLLYPLPIIYGAVGAGWYNTTLDYDESLLGLNANVDETTQEFGWHFGGGLELPLGGSKLTADIRYVFLNYDFTQLPTSDDLESDFFIVTAGFIFGL